MIIFFQSKLVIEKDTEQIKKSYLYLNKKKIRKWNEILWNKATIKTFV